MKIMAWNILHGGGRNRTPRIALALLEHAPDVVVLSEFRTTTGGQIAGILYDHGWKFQVNSDPGPGVNGLLVASRNPIEPGESPPGGLPSARWLDVNFSSGDLSLTAVHVPDSSFGGAEAQARESAFWHGILKSVANRREENRVKMISTDPKDPNLPKNV